MAKPGEYAGVDIQQRVHLAVNHQAVGSGYVDERGFGLPALASAVAHDDVQDLLAIGSKWGSIHMYVSYQSWRPQFSFLLGPIEKKCLQRLCSVVVRRAWVICRPTVFGLVAADCRP